MEFNLNITASKICAFMVIIMGFVLALIYDNTAVFITASGIGTGLFGGKMLRDHYDKKEDRKRKSI